MNSDLSEAEQERLVDQFEAAYSRAQVEYDSSVRTIAAAAVGVTASLAAAFDEAGWSGGLAVAFALACLAVNLISYWTAQFDTSARIRAAWDKDRRGVYGGRWKTATGSLNAASGLLLLASGVCLVAFVSSTA